MPRLRNIHTGAVVDVSDATAEALDDEWEPLEKKAQAKKPATAKKSDTK